MLFLNRRGYSSSLQCPKCGFVAGCPNCSVALTYHRREQKLLCHICGHEQAVPKFRVVKERRATFKATPAQDKRRPPAATPIGNLVLAGDWVQTGLPATIEGAIRSGRTAAKVLLGK